MEKLTGSTLNTTRPIGIPNIAEQFILTSEVCSGEIVPPGDSQVASAHGTKI